MRIFLIRHGFSEGNEDPENYITRGDPQIALTGKGWRQAIAAGRFLKTYFNSHAGSSARGPRLWMSSYNRTRQTASGIVHGADGLIGEKECRVSSHLIEQSFGLFSQIQSNEERRRLMPLEAAFYEASRKRDKYYATMPMGESPQQVQTRVSNIIGTIMRDHDKKGIDDVIVVTHGVTLRAFAMEFLKLDPEAYRDFKNPENGSIYLIEGDGENGYSFRQIYNGDAMRPVNIDWGQKLCHNRSPLLPVPKKFQS